MRKELFIFLLPLSILLGCKKEHSVEMNFRIYNHMASPNIGRGGINVEVFRKRTNGGTEFIWNGKTDDAGRVSFITSGESTKKDKYLYKYDMETYTNGSGNPCNCPHTVYISTPSTNELEKDKPNNINITYASLTFHKATFINDSCTGPTDSFRFRKKYMNVKEGWSQWSTAKYGCDNIIDTEQTYNDSMIYEFEVQRNGVTNIYQKRTVTTSNGIIHF